jgi:hypothetical protein
MIPGFLFLELVIGLHYLSKYKAYDSWL